VPAAAPGECPQPAASEQVYFEGLGRVPTPLYVAAGLKGGMVIRGPAIIMQDVSTVVVEPVGVRHWAQLGGARGVANDGLSVAGRGI
jgi:N-methylhydantoinase A/oxoprolinase/acetone carboxylase beta subunit